MSSASAVPIDGYEVRARKGLYESSTNARSTTTTATIATSGRRRVNLLLLLRKNVLWIYDLKWTRRWRSDFLRNSTNIHSDYSILYVSFGRTSDIDACTSVCARARDCLRCLHASTVSLHTNYNRCVVLSSYFRGIKTNQMLARAYSIHHRQQQHTCAVLVDFGCR